MGDTDLVWDEDHWRQEGDDEGHCPRCRAVVRFYDDKHGIEDCIVSLAQRTFPLAGERGEVVREG